MSTMTPERWEATSSYLQTVFGREDEPLRALRERALARGLPAISVSAEVGRMLHFLVRTTPARRVLEVGTLGGYSAAWMARALAPGGHLYTVELDAAHADFAESALAELGLAERVTVVRGAALEVLPGLLARVEGPLDVVFVDAVKTEYAAYLAAVRGRLAPGSLFLADNVLGTNSWWVTEPGSAARDAMDAFNHSLAQDADFDVCAVPAREGVLLARRR